MTINQELNDLRDRLLPILRDVSAKPNAFCARIWDSQIWADYTRNGVVVAAYSRTENGVDRSATFRISVGDSEPEQIIKAAMPEIVQYLSGEKASVSPPVEVVP